MRSSVLTDALAVTSVRVLWRSKR